MIERERPIRKRLERGGQIGRGRIVCFQEKCFYRSSFEHLLQDESLLLVFCASDGVPPEDIAPARRVLSEIAGEIDDPEFSA